jgi:hypothetical protein
VIVLLVFAVLVLGALGLGLLGVGPLVLRDDRRRVRTESTAVTPLVAIGGGGLLVVVVLLLATGLVLGRGGEASVVESDDEEETAPASTTTVKARPVRTATRAAAPTTAPGVLGPMVSMQASDADGERLPGELDRVVGGLQPDTVLQLHVEGFPAFAAARAKQCADGVCANFLAVQFGEGGTASFQYLVVDDFASSASHGCRLDATPCSIIVENIDGEGRAELGTLFVDALPDPGHIAVDPSRDLVAGQAATVTVDGFRAGTELAVVFCVSGTSRCADLDGSTLVVDRRGAAATTVRVASCPRRSQCSLAVRSPQSFVRSSVVPLAFASPPGAAYDPGRVAAGTALASLLLGAALYVIRRSDWSPVGEEAAPEIDDAVYADLDAIIAALPPEDEPVPA